MVPAFSSTSLLLESSSFQVLVRVLDPSASGRPASQPAFLSQASPVQQAQRSKQEEQEQEDEDEAPLLPPPT